jgi:hypothetical protein
MPPADPTAKGEGRGQTYEMLTFFVESLKLYSVLLKQDSVLYFHNDIWGNYANNYGRGWGGREINELRSTPKYLSVPLGERLVNN